MLDHLRNRSWINAMTANSSSMNTNCFQFASHELKQSHKRGKLLLLTRLNP